MREKIEVKQWWKETDEKFMKQLKTDYKPIICDIVIGRKTYSVVYDGDGLKIKEWIIKRKITNIQKLDAIQMTTEQARIWLFRMEFSKEERILAAKGLIRYCQGILRAEEGVRSSDSQRGKI